MKYGLLGEKLPHSYSPDIHKLFGCPDYALFEVEEENLPAFFAKGDFDGLNVTVPYKKAVIPYLSDLSDAAREAGSVNVIVKRPDGTLFGDNTDAAGFDALLRFANIDPTGKKVLVLGSGGAAGAVRSVLSRKRTSDTVTVSRTGEVNYENVYSLHSDAQIIINATPVGMYPDNGKSPIDIAPFKNLSAVVDLIYNPDKTALILSAEDRGLKAVGGLYMLVYQAALTEEIFRGVRIDRREISGAYTNIRNSKRNIVLIGMPGSGKTVITKRLSAILHREAADIDKIIEKREGRTILEIFETDGEECFRRLETAVTAEVCRESGLIISTGGGVVTREENKNHLRENSLIIYLIRSTSKLTVRNRPISKSVPLEELAKQRIPIYKEWSDVQLLNSEINVTVGEIIRFLRLKPENGERKKR